MRYPGADQRGGHGDELPPFHRRDDSLDLGLLLLAGEVVTDPDMDGSAVIYSVCAADTLRQLHPAHLG